MTERFASAANRLATKTHSAEWKEVTATVRSSTYCYARFRDTNAEDGQDQSSYLVSFTYTVDGELFVDEYRRSEPLEAGHTIVILYDPLKRKINNLSDENATMSFGFKVACWILGLVFAAVLIYFTERFDMGEP